MEKKNKMITKQRSCPVCFSPSQEAKIFLEGNIDTARISRYSFASRKTPEYMSHRLVQCQKCDLVYVDNPPTVENLAEAYSNADYDSSEEAKDAAQSYISAIVPHLNHVEQRNSALEIGTGTGIFLEKLLDLGFKNVIGVEPSKAAINASPENIRSLVREGIFVESDFKEDSFDLICCFMTLEHVHDPMKLTQSAFRLLKKGGAFMTVTHDYRGFVNRMLGKRSPIIDIEHMQLFSRPSLFELFRISGYENIKVNGYVNRYTLRYWLRLMPMSNEIKTKLGYIFEIPLLRDIRVGINVGNVLTVGYRGKN